MTFSLFQLVPTIYRLRDGQIAATMPLLSPTEQTQLTALQTSPTPLTADQEALPRLEQTCWCLEFRLRQLDRGLQRLHDALARK